ncbi:MAG: hypothetical protein LQ340_003487 [Diploschistes diacapsis]|nr:MAG: hypothetical protein LQ340_003487 [Diploschistes diacapsis]
MANLDDVSYIDYETFLAPSFSPVAFANNLVTSTNNASDTAVDLSTPLSKVLFDVQEIDTHIHDLTTKSALPLLTHTRSQSTSANKILGEVSAQVANLTESYQRLEQEVIARHAAAEEVRLAASRLWVTIKIGRAVGRCLLLGRQLEAQITELGQSGPGPLSNSNAARSTTAPRKEDHQAMVRASYSLLTLRAIFDASGRDEEGEHLSRINVVNTLRTDLVEPSEQRLRTRAQQIVREFSLSTLANPQQSGSASSAPGTTNAPTPSPPPGTPTTGPLLSLYAQTEETKSRTTSALVALYLLSPVSPTNPPSTSQNLQPALLLAALQTYLQTALTSSTASLARALASLPTLPRALTEVAARCQNIVALEALLDSISPPPHPLLPAPAGRNPTAPATAPVTAAPATAEAEAPRQTLLSPLLASLDTSSLPSFFWRSLAGQLAPKVTEILGRGGVAARALRGGRERLRESIRETVLRGVEGASKGDRDGGRGAGGGGAGGSGLQGWEREVGVMVGGVVGAIR